MITASRKPAPILLFALIGLGLSCGPERFTGGDLTVDPDATSLTIPSGVAGQVSQLSAVARDSNGTALTRSVGVLQVSIKTGSANQTASVTVVDLQNGSYTASYTPIVAGADTFAVSLGGLAVGGGPYFSVVQPGAPAAAQSTATVSNGQAGVVNQIGVVTRDAHGNVRTATSGVLQVTIKPGSANQAAVVTVVDSQNGTYAASYTPTVAGADTFAISLASVSIGGGPYLSLIQPGPPAPPQSTATVNNGRIGVANQITVVVRDAFGNRQTGGGHSVIVTITGANPGTPSVIDNLDGTYRAQYTPVSTGTDLISITISGTSIGGSPYSSTISATEVSANFELDFGTFADRNALLSWPGWFASTAENPGQVDLSTTVGHPPSSKSMVYTFPDRTGLTATRCTDYGIRPGDLDLRTPDVKGSGVTDQLWVELWVRFSPDFVTRAPAEWSCSSAPDYKFIFIHQFGSSGRWEIKSGTFGNSWAFGRPSGPSDEFSVPMSPNFLFWDGEWHRYRMYAKLGQGSGVFRAWLGDTKVVDAVNISDGGVTEIWGIRLGANMNQGPGSPVTVHWGRLRLWWGGNDPGW